MRVAKIKPNRSGGPKLTAVERLTLRLLVLIRSDLKVVRLAKLFGITRKAVYDATLCKEVGLFMFLEPWASRVPWQTRLRELYEAERTSRDYLSWLSALSLAWAAANTIANQEPRVGEAT